jgi:hypothetical protein
MPSTHLLERASEELFGPCHCKFYEALPEIVKQHAVLVHSDGHHTTFNAHVAALEAAATNGEQDR